MAVASSGRSVQDVFVCNMQVEICGAQLISFPNYMGITTVLLCETTIEMDRLGHFPCIQKIQRKCAHSSLKLLIFLHYLAMQILECFSLQQEEKTSIDRSEY